MRESPFKSYSALWALLLLFALAGCGLILDLEIKLEWIGTNQELVGAIIGAFATVVAVIFTNRSTRNSVRAQIEADSQARKIERQDEIVRQVRILIYLIQDTVEWLHVSQDDLSETESRTNVNQARSQLATVSSLRAFANSTYRDRIVLLGDVQAFVIRAVNEFESSVTMASQTLEMASAHFNDNNRQWTMNELRQEASRLVQIIRSARGLGILAMIALRKYLEEKGFGEAEHYSHIRLTAAEAEIFERDDAEIPESVRHFLR